MGRTSVWLGLTLGLALAGCSEDEEGGGSAGKSGSAGAGESGSPDAGGNAGAAGRSTAGRGGALGSGGRAASGGSMGAGEGGDAGAVTAGAAAAAAGEGGGGGAGAGGEAGDSGVGGDPVGGEGGGAGDAGASSGGSGAGGEAGGGGSVAVVTVFDGGTRTSGAEYSGRSGLDALCASAKGTLAIAGGPSHALISVGPADEIADFPALYGLPTDRPFVSPSGAVIADDFAALLDGSIDRSLEDAGIVITEPGFWFTGSNPDGTASAHHCEGWTYEEFDQTIRAAYGYTSSTDAWWLGGNATATCSAGQYHVLCVTW